MVCSYDILAEIGATALNFRKWLTNLDIPNKPWHSKQTLTFQSLRKQILPSTSATAAIFLVGWSAVAQRSVSCVNLVKVAHVHVLMTRTLVSRVNKMKLPQDDIRKLSHGFLIISESEMWDNVDAQCFWIFVIVLPDSETINPLFNITRSIY